MTFCEIADEDPAELCMGDPSSLDALAELKKAGPQVQPSKEQVICGYEVSMKATSVSGVQVQLP